MSDFTRSSWSEESFSTNYLDRADIYVLERRRMLRLLASIYKQVSGGRKGLRLCDLGCGDGIISETLLKCDHTISATLVDASASMLQKARERLSDFRNLAFIEARFEEILDGSIGLPPADSCVSSLAIHHLDMEGKAQLFRYVHDHLAEGGHFINIDTVRPPSAELERLYFSIWSEWMQSMMDRAGIEDETPGDVIRRYQDPSSTNKPDTLEEQLASLKDSGYKNVDCFYKNGIFAIFGGQKG
jgi:tRNA (cmo5U34)-methyltransferase